VAGGTEAENAMKATLAAILLATALAACGGQNDHQAATTTIATTTTTTTTVPETPEDAFLATVRHAGFGDAAVNDPANADPLVSIGKQNVCGLFDSGASYGQVAQGIIDTKKHPTGEQVKTFIRAAVENFCPRNTASLP